jgi:hypothetical protein
MPVAGGPFIQKTGILLEVDAANAASYPGTGTTWTNIFRPGTFNGTITGSVTYNSTDAYGALQFPANNSYVDFGNVGDLSVSWSFQVAVKPAPSASGNYTILSYTSGSGTGSMTFELDYSSSTQTAVLMAYSTTGSAQVVHRVTGSVSTGSWSIINASYGSSVLGMFVNGRPTDYAVTTGSTVGYSSNNRLIAGGTHLVTSSYYSGSLANFLVYNADVANTRIVQNYNAFATRFGLPPSNLFPYATDPDAFRFIEVANITSSVEVAAVNNLVVGLKSYGLWDKMAAIYPFVGGNAFSHKWNLKNPSDSNSAYRITFSGAIIHSSKGVAFDGSSFANTNLAPFAALTNPLVSNHLSIYVSGSLGGLSAAGNTNFIENGLGIGPNGGTNAYNTNSGLVSVSGQSGLIVATRTAAANSAGYVRGSSNQTNTSTLGATSSPRTVNVNIGKDNGAWSGQGTSVVFSFSSIGTGLTTPDVENLYTVVQAYNTSLNRAFNQ